MHICHLGTQFITRFGLMDDDGNVVQHVDVPVTTNLLSPVAYMDAFQKAIAERKKLEEKHAKPEEASKDGA